MEPKFQEKDRVKQLRGSFIYVVDEIYWGGENSEEPPVYLVHGIDSPSVKKLFREDELEFIGFSNYINYN